MIQELLKEFCETSPEVKKLIVVYGPTGSGKTDLSINIAKYLNSEIISTDSRQIFQGMDIGTGKITPHEMGGVSHHMIDVRTPDQSFSVGEFQKEATKTIEDLFSQGKIPLLVGGTGLYIDSLIYNWDFPKAPSSPAVRERLEQKSPEELLKLLQEKDPEEAQKNHINNTRRIIRALEILEISGKKKSEFNHEKELRYETLFLTPYNDEREELYRRIERRVEIMLEQGLLREIQELLKKYNETDFGMDSIGYREFFPYFSGDISLEEAVKQVKQNTRNYAKRQITWFSSYAKFKNIKDVKW